MQYLRIFFFPSARNTVGERVDYAHLINLHAFTFAANGECSVVSLFMVIQQQMCSMKVLFLSENPAVPAYLPCADTLIKSFKFRAPGAYLITVSN